MGPVEKLQNMGHEVRQFNEYHFRVDGTFDFWYPRGVWHDLITHERGRKPLDQMPYFAHRRLNERPTDCSKESFLNALMQAGWTRGEAERAWKTRKDAENEDP